MEGPNWTVYWPDSMEQRGSTCDEARRRKMSLVCFFCSRRRDSVCSILSANIGGDGEGRRTCSESVEATSGRASDCLQMAVERTLRSVNCTKKHHPSRRKDIKCHERIRHLKEQRLQRLTSWEEARNWKRAFCCRGEA